MLCHNRSIFPLGNKPLCRMQDCNVERDGLAIAIGTSIFRVLQITRPKIVSLGNIPGSDIYRHLQQYRDARRVPGFLILAFEAPINFANTTWLR
ncbi:hypothetical protein J5N97_013124 [Dioscorea zingiberensis]|uniref:Uncharacterized protein n=1 Tax=Dioscorea zingiberensis TaxID=325984 RepID=A0A9D5CSR7_9LILI|nr:hypothetical protein J5N97_013124 [Dioscorea zingiberensis]